MYLVVFPVPAPIFYFATNFPQRYLRNTAEHYFSVRDQQFFNRKNGFDLFISLLIGKLNCNIALIPFFLMK